MRIENKKKLAAALILLAVSVVYANTLPNSFVFDDRHMVVSNNYIKHLDKLPNLFGDRLTSASVAKGMYRPLLMLSYAFNYFFSGLSPHGYHLLNILIHFLNALLLFLLLGVFLPALGFSRRLALTLIFCVHPLNTEAVAYISSRSTILCTLFILSGFYFYLLWRSSGKKALLFWGILSYACALLTKEIGIIFLGLVAAYEYLYTDKRGSSLRRGLYYIFFMTFLYLLLLKLVMGDVFGLFAHAKAVSLPAVRSLFDNVMLQSVNSFFYIYLFFFPFNLSIDHAPFFPGYLNIAGPVFALLVVLAAVSALFARRKYRECSFFVLWYFICLSPLFYARLNVISAEHHAYPALFGVYFLLGYLLCKVKLGRKVLGYSFATLFALFSLLTIIRNFQWRNEYMIWKAALRSNPESAMAMGSIGMELVNRGFFHEGIGYLEASAERASMQRTRVSSLLNLAYSHGMNAEPGRGMDILRKNKAYLWKASPANYLKTLSFLYSKMGFLNEALVALKEALILNPEEADIKALLGGWYLEHTQDYDKVGSYFSQSLKDDPDFALAHFGMGRVLEKKGLYKEAAKQYQQTLNLSPDSINAYYRLGLLYSMRFLDGRAEGYFKKVIELDPSFAPAYYNLCVLYLSFSTPDYPSARRYFDQAKGLGYKPDAKIEELLDIGAKGINGKGN